MAGSILILDRQCRFPLQNINPLLVLTRPLRQSARFLAQLQVRLGADIAHMMSPVLQIDVLDPHPQFTTQDTLIFTSENAVLAIAQSLAGMRAFCVGQRTAKAAQDKGCDTICADGDARDLIALVLSSAPTGRLVHLRGTHTRGDIQETLAAKGLDVVERCIYTQRAVPLDVPSLSTVPIGSALIFPVFSPRTAEIIAQDVENLANRCNFICISDATSKPFLALECQSLSVSNAPNGAAMIDAVAHVVQDVKNS
jgi:uroporphyrinogen-III synthase